MKSRLKLQTLMPVLSDDVKDLLQELESESEDFELDNAEVKRASVSNDAADFEDGERAAIKYISTRTVDRYKEVLVPSGAILKQYKQNPIVLWAHDYSQPPIGKSEWVKVDDYGIKSKTVYAETERAEEIWQLVKGGFIKTSSVGFIPIESTYKGMTGWDALVQKYNAEWSTDLEKDGVRYITTKWALLEYSDVPVPCNPDALVVAVAKGFSLSPGMRDQLGIGEIEEAVNETVKNQKTSIIEVISRPKGIIEVIEQAHTLINRRA